ncbi:hypothetical protein [Rhodanobacter ginsenosidimutans]|uniref:DUF885 domain-containing protein n=1 Tax=Rhodanobacter ginsenosidimutans TaxID=490571 RepID=A0ABW0JYF4_9GAMM
MRRFVACIPLLLLLTACSPTPPADAPTAAQQTQPANTPPANAALGSPGWYAWVDRTLAISDNGHGPDHGSAEWNQAVQHKLGQEAPQSEPGSPQWQQSVDALLRTRVSTMR